MSVYEMKFLKSRAGFSLVEMVLVIGILAILITVSMPALFQFIERRDVQTEENAQLEIRKALQAYLAENNRLPPAASWSTDLAGFTNLSVAQIANDTWQRPRAYIMYMDTSRQIQGSAVEIYYATVHSAGPDGIAVAATGIAVSGNAFAAETNNQWWSRIANQQTATFSTLASGGDDLMIRFTDYPEKLERYNLTQERMDRVINSLEAYAKNAYANKIAACGTLPIDLK